MTYPEVVITWERDIISKTRNAVETKKRDTFTDTFTHRQIQPQTPASLIVTSVRVSVAPATV